MLGPGIRFEPQGPASYSGPVAFQYLFSLLGVGERLWGCFRHLGTNPIYDHHVVMMLPVVHLIIGHRRLRDMGSYRDDGMVRRIPGPERLPSVSTVSRSLAAANKKVSPRCGVNRDVWSWSAWRVRDFRG